MPKRPPSYKPRKIPQQARARATVEAILDAAAHLLADAPDADFDTNEVAARAGVSIGSLYQYFPNKGAVLSALIERHVGQKLERLQQRLQVPEGSGLEQLVERVLDAFISDKREELALERALYVHFHRVGDVEAIAALDRPAIDALTRLAGGNTLRAFVLLHAVRSTLLAASFERAESLADGSLRDELLRLVCGYLGPLPSTAARRST